jgi:formate hydrogenlyase transcriptional activator
MNSIDVLESHSQEGHVAFMDEPSNDANETLSRDMEEDIDDPDSSFSGIIGRSTALRVVLNLVEMVAPNDSTVLLLGETGTGKELVARAIHDQSLRRNEAFVKFNCAAVPTGLLESELFGHEKGAFTGAIAQRIGRFEVASDGTLFLDEIGEIPLELQPKLLSVLQDRAFERLGGTRTLRTNTRLIAATNRDLATMVEEGKFREDLFYRLNVFPIRMPALRERPEDIPLLARHFTKRFARGMKKGIESISPEAMTALSRHHWPGNIRELQNVIERAVIVSPGPVLQLWLSDFMSVRPTYRIDGQTLPAAPGNLRRIVEDTERQQILAALEAGRWVIAGPNGAAARLGMKRSSLQWRMQKLGIARPQ